MACGRKKAMIGQDDMNAKGAQSEQADGMSVKSIWSMLTARDKKRALLSILVIGLSSLTLGLSVVAFHPVLTLAMEVESSSRTGIVQAYAESVGNHERAYLLTVFGVAAFVLIAFNALAQVARIYFIESFAQKLIHTLSQRLLSNYMRQPILFFNGENTGELGKSLLDDSKEVVRYAVRPLLAIASGCVSGFVVVAILLKTSATITIAGILVTSASYVLFYVSTRKHMSKQGAKAVEHNAGRHRITREALLGVRDVKALGAERTFELEYSMRSSRLAESLVNSTMLNSAPRWLFEGVVLSAIVIVLVYHGLGQQSGSGGEGFTLASAGILAIGTQKLLPEVQKIFAAVHQMRFGEAAYRSVKDGLDLSASVEPGAEAGRFSGIKTIQLDDVRFRYPGSAELAIQGISQQASRGEHIGIVGSTGSGKSTLADIILFLVGPTSGTVKVNGAKVACGDYSSLRRRIGYVPQKIFLIDGTVAENVALGDRAGEIDTARVQAVLDEVSLSDFIRTKLPEGINTRIGEDGLRLSGGQRQRLGLARALYRGVDVLILDEASSALDNVTEQKIIAAIEMRRKDLLIFTIAHRLGTVKSCDRVWLLEGGRITASGPWEQNLSESAAFRDLVSAGEVQK